MNTTQTTAGAVALRSWLATNEMSARQFANTHSLSPRSVQQWLSGKCAPRMDKAGVVAHATGGYVKVELWAMRG